MEQSMYQNFFDNEMKHWWFVSRRKIVEDFISRYVSKHNERNLKILDAGCGCGVMLGTLCNFGTVYGLDYSNTAIEFSKKLFEGRLECLDLSGTSFPADYNNFDLIICLDILEHIDDDICALNNIFNMLSPNGIAIITVPAFMFLWSKHDEMNWHKRRYAINELKRKLKLSKYTIKKVSYFNFLLFLPAAFFRILSRILVNKKESIESKVPNKFFNEILKAIFLVEKYFLRFVNLPFGLSIISVISKT